MNESLIELAAAAGVSPRWKDYRGEFHDVEPDTLRAVLAALELPCATESEMAESLRKARLPAASLPLITGVAGHALDMPIAGKFRIALEGGGFVEGADAAPVIDQIGYHSLEAGDHPTVIAIAPRSGWGLPRERCWGLAAQMYSLRRKGDAGIGDFSALADFVRGAARHGADAVAISPVHAQFSADPDRFSPYSPSSRIMLNAFHADAPAGDAALEALDLVDWPAASRARLAAFRKTFERDKASPEFAAFRRELGEPLEAHARFEALHGHFYPADPARWNWHDWPIGFQNPASAELRAFAVEHADEIAFHAYLQFLADRGLGMAQRAAKDAGMAVGLIADLAVGTDGGGSHAWSRQHEMLIGLSVGAPPDLLNTRGQNWGITAFSPVGLRMHGFGAFLEMLRSALRHAGGVRIDHVMGLCRLWVVPIGAPSAQGAYLALPATDLLRLTSLESHRHRAVVLGEDLGTVPDGFQGQLIEAGLLGMRVLWFEQYGDNHFKPPSHWSHEAVAMTTTHDLPTAAGWWRGTDVGWRRKIGLLADDDAAWFENENRARSRGALWHAMRESGAAEGDAPPIDEPTRFVDAAVAHVARSNCQLALLPIEDALGRVESPNLPGTMDEHPNWRRRMPGPATELLDAPDVAARLKIIAKERRAT